MSTTAQFGKSAEASGPLGEKAKGRERHTRQSVRRLKAVANAVHSADTLRKPRSSNPPDSHLLFHYAEDWLD